MKFSHGLGPGSTQMTVRILCILPILTDARIAKRIDMLLEKGFQVEALGFERDQYLGRKPNCPVQSLGSVSDGRYPVRIYKMALAFPKVRAAIRRNDIVYTFGLDLALLALISGTGLGRPTIIEVADIRKIQIIGGLKGCAVRAIDRRVTRACRLLVLMNDSYLDYYRNWLRVATPSLVIENKIDGSFAATVRTGRTRSPRHRASVPLVNRPLRIGLFGYLRDAWSLRVLDSLTRLMPHKFFVVLAGAQFKPCQKLFAKLADNPDIELLSSYHHPNDLPDLYNGIDMTMACYSPDIPSCWSQSNRYYDACLFQKPLIVREGCRNADEVKKYDIGLVITASDVEKAAASIGSVTARQWEHWQANMAAIPPEVYSTTNEADILQAAIAGTLKDPFGKTV